MADAFIQVLFAEDTAKNRPELVDEVYRWLAATSPAGLLLGLRGIRDRIDSTKLLPELDLPALVIGAEGDRAIPVEHAENLAALVPGAVMSRIEEAGHMVNLERPEAFNQSLIGFLDSVFWRG